MRKINTVILLILAILISQKNAYSACSDTTIDNSKNVFACQSNNGFNVLTGGEYWIRMSIGFESETQAIADKPIISLGVTMNGDPLPMDGDTIVQYNEGAGLWEINSYHCTSTLTSGAYNITGTSYRNGNYVDSADCVLTAVDKPYNVEWWYVQHRINEDGRDFNVSHFAMKDLNDNYVLEDVIEKIELFDPDGNKVQLSENSGFGAVYKSLSGKYNSDIGQWQYGDAFNQESYYRVEFDEPLKIGTYHMRLTDSDGKTYDSYNDFNGPVMDLPIIPSDSFYSYKDESGNFNCSWDVPENLASDLSTSVRIWVSAMTDGVDLGEGEIYVKVPTHMGRLFIPASVYQNLESTGNSFKIGMHLRSNDNVNRAYSNSIVFDETNKPPIKGDFNSDGKIGIEEAINALKITSGQ